MPVVKVNPARQIGKSIHYITTGNYGKGGTFNQPHSNRGDKDISQRNYYFDGYNCSDNPSIAMHQMNYFMSQKHNVKNHCLNIIIAYGTTFDWRKPNDLALGREFNHALLQKVFPNCIAFGGYQMDTRGKRPSAHTHFSIANVNMDTMKALSHNQEHGTRLIHISERLVKDFNEKYPWHPLADFTIKHQRRYPSVFEQQIINRMKPVLNNPNITTESQFTYAMAEHGAIAHFTHIGDVIDRTKNNQHMKTRYYDHPGLMIKVPGITYGYVGAYQLSKYNMKYSVYGVENRLHYNAQHLTQTNKYYAQHERDMDSLADMMAGVNEPTHNSKSDIGIDDTLSALARHNIDNRLRADEKQVEDKMISIHELMPKLSNKQVQQFMIKDMNQIVPHLASGNTTKKQQAESDYNHSLDSAHANSNDRKLIHNENHSLLQLAKIDFHHFNQVIHKKASQVKNWIHDKYEIAKQHTDKVLHSLDANMKSGMADVMSKLTTHTSSASQSMNNSNKASQSSINSNHVQSSIHQASNSNEKASYHSNESNVVNSSSSQSSNINEASLHVNNSSQSNSVNHVSANSNHLDSATTNNFNYMNNDIDNLANPYESINSSNIESNNDNNEANQNHPISHVSNVTSSESTNEIKSNSSNVMTNSESASISASNSASLSDAIATAKYDESYEDSVHNDIKSEYVHDYILNSDSSSSTSSNSMTSDEKEFSIEADQSYSSMSSSIKSNAVDVTESNSNHMTANEREFSLEASESYASMSNSIIDNDNSVASTSSSNIESSNTNSFKSEIIASANHENSIHASIEDAHDKQLAMTPDKQISMSKAIKHKASINNSIASSASVSGHSNMSPATSYETEANKEAKELDKLETRMDNSGSISPADINKEYNLRDKVYTHSMLAKKASLSAIKSVKATKASSSHSLGTNGVKSLLSSMSQSAISAHTSAMAKYMRHHHGISPTR